jgi:hypothetical protein
MHKARRAGENTNGNKTTIPFGSLRNQGTSAKNLYLIGESKAGDTSGEFELNQPIMAGNEFPFLLALLAFARIPEIAIAVKPENGKVTNRPVLLPKARATPKRKKITPTVLRNNFEVCPTG